MISWSLNAGPTAKLQKHLLYGPHAVPMQMQLSLPSTCDTDALCVMYWITTKCSRELSMTSS